MSYGSLVDQQPMALDPVRNEAYAAALGACITEDSVVLDLGAGIGTLGLMAARMGARRVYLVEPEDVVTYAQRLADANGLSDRVVVLQGRIEDIVLPERVDVITSVMTGNFLLSEDLLPALLHARDRYLAPSGVMLPSDAVMEVAPVEHAAYHARTLGRWQEKHHGLDLTCVAEDAAHWIYWGWDAHREASALADPVDLWHLDLTKATSADCRAVADVDAAQDGCMHGWLGWFRMRLGDAWLSTSPFEARTHWGAAFLPLLEPTPLAAGAALGFELQRAPESDWHWTSTVAGRRMRQSTFFGRALSRSSLQRAALDACPELGEEGRATAVALAAMDGTSTLETVAAAYRGAFAPADAPSEREAVARVRALVQRFGARGQARKD